MIITDHMCQVTGLGIKIPTGERTVLLEVIKKNTWGAATTGDLKLAYVTTVAIISLRGYTCLQIALSLLQLFLEPPSETSFIIFYFKFVGPSLIIYQFYRRGTPWLVISKSHVFFREWKFFLPKHSK